MTYTTQPQIQIYPYKTFPKNKRKFVLEQINISFGDIPIVLETEWAKPDWYMTVESKDHILCFLGIIERKIYVNKSLMNIAGLNNFITQEEYRGQGLGTRLLREFDKFTFHKIRVKGSLLFCSNELVPFYQKHQWQSLTCPVYYNQKGLLKIWEANAMIKSPDRLLNPKKISINGLPW